MAILPHMYVLLASQFVDEVTEVGQNPGHVTCTVTRAPCLEGSHAWFNALLSPS